VKLEFEILVFVEGEKLENSEKNPQSKARVNNRLDPHNYGSRLELNLGTLMEGESSQHCTIQAGPCTIQ